MGFFKDYVDLDSIQKLVIIGSIIKGWNIFNQHRKQQCSKVASELKGCIEECIDDVIEIADTSENVQYSHIKEDLMIDLQSQKGITKDPVKPPRLIKNKIRQLKNESYQLVAQIPLKEAAKLRELIIQLQKYGNSLGSVIFAKLNDPSHLNIPYNQKILNSYREDLLSIKKSVDDILDPLIEGKINTWKFLCCCFNN